MLRIGIIFFIFLALNAWCSSEPISEPISKPIPKRIASINLCIDQLLWKMVAPERLVSLSYLSADARWSPIAKQLKQSVNIKLNHGLAEELILQTPELILAGDYDAAYALDLLQRFDYRVLRLPTPQNIVQVKQQIADLGKLVGAENKASLIIDDINKKLEQAAQHRLGYSTLSAYWYTANGIVVGKSTFENDLMQAIGLRNLAAERGIEGFAQLDLEILLASNPDIIILEENKTTDFSLAREFMQHPALINYGRMINHNVSVIQLPANLSGCAASLIDDLTKLFTDLPKKIKIEKIKMRTHDQAI
jgi:iron complex transport system substrate-binding protein